MTLAGYQVDLVDAGRFALDGGAMFGIVPRALWSRRIAPDGRNRIPMAAHCLLLRGHGRVALVDTGMGDKHLGADGGAKFADIYAAGPSTLVPGLAALGVAPADVTDVLLTHLHFDHVGGAVSRGADGALGLTFPEATHHVQRRQWDWAHASPREGASFLAENLDPLGASGRLRLLDGPESPLPETALHLADGHTRGQQLLRVGAGRGALLFAGDLLPTAAHVPPLWIMAYDIAPLDTLAEKTALLERAAAERWTVVFEHDAATPVGRVDKTDRGFAAVDLRGTLG